MTEKERSIAIKATGKIVMDIHDYEHNTKLQIQSYTHKDKEFFVVRATKDYLNFHYIWDLSSIEEAFFSRYDIRF